jgi:hypothetical protein
MARGMLIEARGEVSSVGRRLLFAAEGSTMNRDIFGLGKGPGATSKEQTTAIPSLEELRNSLVPVSAQDSPSNAVFKRNSPPVSELAPQRSAPPTSSDFVVLRHDLSKFGPETTIVCRLCREQAERSVILRPKRPNLARKEIERSLLEGWLKHDIVFFGESYLCERCAEAEGFI